MIFDSGIEFKNTRKEKNYTFIWYNLLYARQ